eukprot:TRINITY_DN7076_c0_g1_i1.p1 TRINITY_DN7076_c0_g1~~TRINITY_DN7076_c0_g1_i1.p1  ORF type:complete len:240 (-),score=35.40 TRINITY_DN7076_c0_g1_i1:59-778(-)
MGKDTMIMCTSLLLLCFVSGLVEGRITGKTIIKIDDSEAALSPYVIIHQEHVFMIQDVYYHGSTQIVVYSLQGELVDNITIASNSPVSGCGFTQVHSILKLGSILYVAGGPGCWSDGVYYYIVAFDLDARKVVREVNAPPNVSRKTNLVPWTDTHAVVLTTEIDPKGYVRDNMYILNLSTLLYEYNASMPDGTTFWAGVAFTINDTLYAFHSFSLYNCLSNGILARGTSSYWGKIEGEG